MIHQGDPSTSEQRESAGSIDKKVMSSRNEHNVDLEKVIHRSRSQLVFTNMEEDINVRVS